MKRMCTVLFLLLFSDKLVLFTAVDGIMINNMLRSRTWKAGEPMKTLYVSDLDGTLLHSDERTSDFTNATINQFVENGMLFSYATARSYQTSHKVTKGLNAQIPLIIYNGAITVDNKDGALLLKNFSVRK